MSVLVELPEDDYSSSAFNAFVPAAAFDMGTARAMMWLSQLAYESNHAKIDRIASAWRLDRVIPFAQPVRTLLPMSETCGLIVERSGVLIVAFAGTAPSNRQSRQRSKAVMSRVTASGFEQAMDPVWEVSMPPSDLRGRTPDCYRPSLARPWRRDWGGGGGARLRAEGRSVTLAMPRPADQACTILQSRSRGRDLPPLLGAAAFPVSRRAPGYAHVGWLAL